MAKPPPPKSRKTAPAGLPSSIARLLGQPVKPAQPAPRQSQPTALLTEANQLLQRGEWRSAQALADQVLAQAPNHQVARNIRAITAAQLNQHAQAEAAWRALLQHDPDFVDARSNLGRLLQITGRLDEAVQQLQHVTRAKPDHADAHMNLGVALDRLGRHDEAMASYERTLALRPRNAQALFNIGKLLQDRHDFAGAHARYREALAIDPTHDGAGANLAFTQHYLADFDPAINRDTARAFAAQLPRAAPRTPAASPSGRPLRVGFVSADLRVHPVGYFLESVLGHLRSDRLQLFAYSNSAFEDALTERLKPAFARWQAIDTYSDSEAAALITRDEVDVLIDLSGLTQGHRQGVFALRPAAVQAGWLGYFSTTGNPAIDHVLADPVTVPAAEESLFTEHVWRLPHIRYCFTAPAAAPEVAVRAADPARAFTFGSFQTLPKINARVLRSWARILQAAPGARLRVQNSQMDSARWRASFESQLAQLGVARDRIDLMGQQSRTDYLAAHAEVDVVLDTFPYPGGTTTAEALWMGVPTLTLALPGMLGRQGEAMMAAVGLPDWVVRTDDDYVNQAVAWANAHPQRLAELAQLRAGLRARAAASPLFDAPRFARDLEAALRAMARAQPTLQPAQADDQTTDATQNTA